MTEEWRDVVGYEGVYQVSNWGRVKRLGGTPWRKYDRLLKPALVGAGYYQMRLCTECKKRYFYVHQLVAQAFIPNPNGYTEVNHIDENKLNNRVENLEWCDHHYNLNYGVHNAKLSLSATNNIKRSKPVSQYTLDGQFVKTYPSMGEAQRNGFFTGAISNCCRGKQKQHSGYIWKYA